MTKILSFFLPLALALIVSTPVATYSADYKKEGAKKVMIIPCLSISDTAARKLCSKERDLRIARRALDILSVGPGDSTHGGASDCAATAEADCEGSLQGGVGTLSYEDGICIWTCTIFAPNP